MVKHAYSLAKSLDSSAKFYDQIDRNKVQNLQCDCKIHIRSNKYE